MKNLKTYIYSLLLIVFLLAPLTTSFTVADTKVNFNDYKSRHRIGCKCCDGTNSSAKGRGACSHHGGVRYWKYSDGTTESTGRCD